MASTPMRAALRQVDRLFREGTNAGLPDGRLLDRFLAGGDDDAFATLVARHGPMVLRTGLDLLRDPSDAEDAFQATFLALARRGASIRGGDAVGAWLHRIARRAAGRLNALAARRRREERRALASASTARATPGDDRAERDEVRRAIHAEIDRLPERVRCPVVLCLLEGMSQPEAAARLGVSEGAVRGRLARARVVLRERLTRRGLAPALIAFLDGPGVPAVATIPAAWVGAAVAAARGVVAEEAVAVAASAPVVVKHAVAMLVAAGVALAAATLATATPSPAPAPATRPAPPQFVGHEPPEKAGEKPASGRMVTFRGRVLGPDGRGVAGARFSVVTDAWAAPGDRGASGPDGAYRFAMPEADFRKNFSAGSTASPRVQMSILVTAEGLGPDWWNLHPGETAMKPEYVNDFHLVADRPIAGRLVDAAGKPVVGAKVAVGDISAPEGGRWEPILAALKALDANFLYSHAYPWSSPIHRMATSVIPAATTDADGRFRVAGVGRDRLVHLAVTGPGVMPTDLTILTRDDVDELTRAIRAKFPRTRQADGITSAKAAPVNPGVPAFGPNPDVEVDPARTISGVVRAADTGEPFANFRLGESMQMNTDARGRYRGLRHNASTTVTVYAVTDQAYPYAAADGRRDYLDAARRFEDVGGLGEVVADFDLRRGVIIAGHVFEAGTTKPIVSAPRDECGTPGALQAGFVHYLPLATNAALRGTPEGLAFEVNPATIVPIGGDGAFRLAVPPGPGILLVEASPGLPMMLGGMPRAWQEIEGDRPVHRLFPYARLKGRTPDDGAPGPADAESLPGFNRPIAPKDYHAYRVIDPAPDAKAMTIDFELRRAPARLLRFVGPDGRPVRGLTILGLLGKDLPAASVEGSEAEATGLDPDRSREILALSHDGRFHARSTLRGDATGPATIRLDGAGSVSGRLVDDAGRPLADHSAYVSYGEPDAHGSGLLESEDRIPRPTAPVKTDADGRFRIVGLVPGPRVVVAFHAPVPSGPFIGQVASYIPESLRGLALRPGEAREVGDIKAGPRRP